MDSEEIDSLLKLLGVDPEKTAREYAEQYEREYQQKLEKEIAESDDHVTILLRRILHELRTLNKILIASVVRTTTDREQ